MFALVSLSVSVSTAQANELNFNLLEATPLGSWQINEQITTNRKGKQSGSRVKMSLVGKEERNGETHYWLEMAAQEFKISKKGKRKNKGKRSVIKSLVPESLMTTDPANVMSSLSKFGTEVIIQNGNEDPMRIPDTGNMMATMMQFASVDIKYDFDPRGQETVNVAAGEFLAEKVFGTGSAEIKVFIKTMKVESERMSWYSQKIPFGIIKAEGSSTTNGKVSQETSELIEFGMFGAETEITKPAKDMPATPGLDGLFGK